MSMSDHIKQRVLQEFLPHIEDILPIWSRGSVAHCFNLLHNVRYRTTERTASNR